MQPQKLPESSANSEGGEPNSTHSTAQSHFGETAGSPTRFRAEAEAIRN